MTTGIMEGAVRARGLILAQTDEVKQPIFDQVSAGMEAYRSCDGVYRIPMPAIVRAALK